MEEDHDGNDNVNSSSYGLRENPKKSWRASSSSTATLPFENAKICKQCGKGFKSLKALCGHMAFHSEKDRGLKGYDDDSWTSESDSDTDENELQDPVCVTRSESKRYKKVVTIPTSLSLTNTNSTNSNYNYGSSSVSEIDEFEQEDVAMWLMMLSKDSSNWGGVNSVVESSDNTSGELEAKLSSVEMKKSRNQWNLAKNDVDSFAFENSNSGSCRNGIKKVESRNCRDLSYEEKQEIRRNLFREFGYDSSLNKRISSCRDDDSYKKRNKYECVNCNRTFSSFQGLGGHRPCHKKNNAFIAGGNRSDAKYARNQKTKLERPKKNKGHECPICFRMFKSGQALGGHKRSHFISGSEDRTDHVAAIEQVEATYTDMIDLNLPAPEED
ncbi:putative transcription factor C2H2 family [Helianthus annuus]|nr:putative transcription factor C2H2 family [Helianthus annuus]